MVAQTYESPRWSGEILDCSMPLTFDTYNKCSYNCMYCFSYYQKSIQVTPTAEKKEHYQVKELTSVNPNKIRRLLECDPSLPAQDRQFFPYIQQRRVIQWGGLSDQFDSYEKRTGTTLELLKIFKEKNYPLCFSTKATWWLYDDRYRELFKGQDNWNVKFSIINLDPERAKLVEKGVASPAERLKAIGEYTKLNKGGATLRLRPFIIGLTDYNNEHLDVIKLAKEQGASAVSTEFFCLERRAQADLLARYKKMSDVIGFDILDFYARNSKGQSGYLRLNYELKRPYIDTMKELCDKLGMRFYVSDAHHKEKSSSGSCCGLEGDKWNFSKGQFTNAIVIAKEKGYVTWDDIKEDVESLHSGYHWHNAAGFNTCGALARGQRKTQKMSEYIREHWNNTKSKKSPYHYFAGLLIPTKLDKNNNVVYKFNYGKAGIDAN